MNDHQGQELKLANDYLLTLDIILEEGKKARFFSCMA